MKRVNNSILIQLYIVDGTFKLKVFQYVNVGV